MIYSIRFLQTNLSIKIHGKGYAMPCKQLISTRLHPNATKQDNCLIRHTYFKQALTILFLIHISSEAYPILSYPIYT